ncbi:6-phospho-beta-glucosidase [Spinactinospora alkalitolerans]|uniref:6-phospho-beta-glucosidase n=1 Tax=Spinactinospora alkalitolerans TaxID=687207 RepID=A0A852U192_9ACTN|nr:6-phospho-beta-glucosidase [Spinactinospora alkalitolerans]NYE49979.1 6-phospho-beta-glucosidase [Spinactinospora alkalitolerans]
MRLAILGGGGFRVPLVHRALLADTLRGDAPITEVVLCDTDARRLRAIGAVLDRQRDAHRAAHGEPGLAVRAETGLAAALDGCDIVFSAIRVGGMPGRVLDERVALAAGVLGQETVGAGGISYGLRTLPVAGEIARTTAERAPGAWVVNFTNPAGLVTEAMSAVLGDRVIGICDSPVGLGRRAARALGLDPAGVGLDYAGLNHLGWLRGLHADGRDRLPDLLADEAALSSFEEGRLFGPSWLRALGALPNEYLHYYYMARESRASIAETVAGGGETRGEQLVDQQEAFYRDAAARPAEAYELWDRARLEREETYMADNRRAAGGVERDEEDLDGGGYEQVALAVMRAIARDEPARLIVNVRNRGAIAGLDGDAVVEVPCLVDAAGAGPLAVGALTGHQSSLVQAVKAVEREIVDAVRTGSRTPALRAFATHPLVDSVATARTLLDGYLKAFPELERVLPRP